MKCHLAPNRNLCGAFRPLDLAAIVCVLGVLTFVGIIASGQIKERALRNRCRGNLMNIGKSLDLYAADNHGELPDCSGNDPRYGRAGWPWNMETNLTAALEAKGLIREKFYCPANPTMNDDRHWNFSRVVGGTSRVIGYGMLFRGTATVPPGSWVSRLADKNSATPSQTELGFDSTACINGDYTRIQGLWVDRSNHMRKQQPVGGNVLCQDEHVEWRNFNGMEVRFHTVGPGGVIDWSY